MKKKDVLLIGIIIALAIIAIYTIPGNNKSVKLSTSAGNISDKSTLALMYEITSGSGEYAETSNNTWPTDGYVFNASLSKCENGGTLSWDETTSSVVFKGNMSDKCYVYFDFYTAVTINKLTSSDVTSTSFTITVDATAGEGAISKYYYSSDGGSTYYESTSNSYTFNNNITKGTEYNVSVYIEDSNGRTSAVSTTKVTTLSTVYLADYIKGLYTSDGTDGLYYHDGKGSYTNASYEAGDNSYRYSGANPNNYVCFGSTASTCPTDNLYRIIGVFGNQVKLIKYDYATSTALGTGGDYYGTGSHNSTYKGSQSTYYGYYWNSSGTNTWSSSALNTTNLNTTYTNGLGTTWTNLIETTTWKVGGNTYAKIADTTVNNTYANEITSPAATTTHSAKIGLMYVSDYGYAAAPSAWSTNLSSYNASTITSVNWMYMGEYEWTISRISDDSFSAFVVNISGVVSDYYVDDGYAVRPSFYLKSSVAYSSGTGSSSDPIRVS